MPSEKRKVTAYLDATESRLFDQLKQQQGFDSDSALLRAMLHLYVEQQEDLIGSQKHFNQTLQRRFDALQTSHERLYRAVMVLVGQQALQQMAVNRQPTLVESLRWTIRKIVPHYQSLDKDVNDGLRMVASVNKPANLKP